MLELPSHFQARPQYQDPHYQKLAYDLAVVRHLHSYVSSVCIGGIGVQSEVLMAPHLPAHCARVPKEHLIEFATLLQRNIAELEGELSRYSLHRHIEKEEHEPDLPIPRPEPRTAAKPKRKRRR